jgi:DNA-directed RNA polymerase subunit M/transcription elongation factor TFIIS
MGDAKQDIRKAGMMMLMSHFNSDDSTVLEDIVYKKSKDSKSIYKNILSDIHVFVATDNKSYADVIDILNTGKFMWNHPKLDDIANIQNEIFSYIESPFEIVDGMFTCPKCGSTKTVSYSKQTRSSDEGMSTFVFCTNRLCKHGWMYSG